MDSLPQYLLALVDHWAALMTGGILIAILALFERARGQAVSWRAYLLIAVVCFFVASFLAWKDENAAKLHAECLLSHAQNAKEIRKRFVSQHLQSFLVRVTALRRHVDAAEFPAWIKENQTLGEEMFAWVKSNMGEGAAAKLIDMNGQTYDFAPLGPVNADNLNILNGLNKIAGNLGTLQREPEWDTFQPPTATDCK